MPQKTLTTPQIKLLHALKADFALIEYKRKDGGISGQYLVKGKTKKYVMRILLADLLNDGLIEALIDLQDRKQYKLSDKGRELVNA